MSLPLLVQASIQEEDRSDQFPDHGTSFCAALRCPAFRKSLYIAVAFAVAVTVSGRYICFNYSSDMLRSAGLDDPNAELTALIAQLFGIPALIFVLVLIDHVGPRVLFLTTLGIILCLQVPLAICYLCLRPNVPTTFGLTAFMALCICIWVPVMIGGSAGLSFMPIEFFSQDRKEIGYAIFCAAYFGLGSVSIALFPIVDQLRTGAGVLSLTIPLLLVGLALKRWLPEVQWFAFNLKTANWNG